MADQHYEYRSTEKIHSGGGAIAFVVGGLVVLVGIIAYIVFGGHIDVSGNSAQPTSIEVNTNADSAAGADAADSSAGAAAETDGGDAAAAAGASSTD